MAKQVIHGFVVTIFVTLGLVACTTDPCGNGVIDDAAGESCDGTDLGQLTCGDYAAFGQFGGGELKCTNQCLVDTSPCDPCWGYPCQPWGAIQGEVMQHETFMPGNSSAKSMAIDAHFDTSDIYQSGISRDGNIKGLVIFVTTEWCTYCTQQANMLEELYTTYQEQGILMVGLVTQNSNFEVATASDADAYADEHGWTFPSVAGSLQYAYWNSADWAGAVPLTLFVDVRNMKIFRRQIGAFQSADDMKPYLDSLIQGTGGADLTASR